MPDVILYITIYQVIESFRHKGLQRFFTTGSTRGIVPQHATRLKIRLHVMDLAVELNDIVSRGWHFHALSGDRAGTYAINVTGNWRLTFRFENENCYDVDYEDYH